MFSRALLTLIFMFGVPALGAGWNYDQPPTPAVENMADWYSWKNRLEQAGLILISASWDGAWAGAHQIATSIDGERLVIVRLGLSAKAAVPDEFSVAGGTVYHIPESEGRFTGVFVRGVSGDSLRALLGSKAVRQSRFSFLPRANAEEVCDSRSPLRSEVFQGARDVQSHIDEGRTLAQIGQCASGVAAGATMGLREAGDFFVQLFSDPTKLWADVVASAEQLQTFVLSLRTEVKGLVGSLKGVSGDVLQAALCPLAGQLIASIAARGGVAAWAKAPLLFASASRSLKRSAQWLKTLTGIRARRGMSSEQLNRIMGDWVRCGMAAT